ncbi:hypothetical protein [Hyalangium rubrum]|uniref:Uncharacterized protein n=1 Tax=Hyalangium rubrum TaxID=3103134 RepID=A0ABU5HCI6_9BACT|nr:hypothetical protein [Hyalangium sp. s54d21]MDY7231041.1 hypothetical protein [Hyalangium sp. s54d21]
MLRPLSSAASRVLRLLLWLTCFGLGLVVAVSSDDTLDYKHPLAEGTPICGRPDFNQMFPYSLRSTKYPVMVHYYREVEKETAQKVLGYIEKGWDYHANQLGMRPAITDASECGPDDAFDVFVWKGHRGCLVNALSGEDSTAWDDRRGYMIVDAWGPYGGSELEETVVHEMAHASQAADDWYESPITFEMSAVFTDQVYANRYIKTYLNDFQAHPDWALDYYDKYETWYMYGSSLYLLYLKDRFFDGQPRFISDIWLASRNPPGAQDDQTLNDPDFADAIDGLLSSQGSSYVQTVPEFSRWRWYTGDHVDDRHFRHFKDGLDNLKAAKLTLAAQQEAAPGTISITENAPMMLGTSYIELSAGASTPEAVYVSLQAPNDVRRRFVVQAVPGLTPDSDGEILDLASGPKPLEFAADQRRTLIVTVVPTGTYDPDLRSNDRHPFSVALSDRP